MKERLEIIIKKKEFLWEGENIDMPLSRPRKKRMKTKIKSETKQDIKTNNKIVANGAGMKA